MPAKFGQNVSINSRDAVCQKQPKTEKQKVNVNDKIKI